MTKDQLIAAQILAEFEAEQAAREAAAAVPARVVAQPYPPASFVRQLEDALAQILAQVGRRLDRLEHALSTERRLAALEAGMAKGDSLQDRLDRGEPVSERAWLTFVQRMQNRDLGAWTPAHATWRGGR
jgi:hypothetical protein